MLLFLKAAILWFPFQRNQVKQYKDALFEGSVSAEGATVQ